jgi:hypothetical protein
LLPGCFAVSLGSWLFLSLLRADVASKLAIFFVGHLALLSTLSNLSLAIWVQVSVLDLQVVDQLLTTMLCHYVSYYAIFPYIIIYYTATFISKNILCHV